MIVANQQANIKNVNGALADTLANRPAAQSTFYLFYATDTQEIYYDNGSWILLGSGGGGAVNIYNSDGTLTGNRFLSGSNFVLGFNGLDAFVVSTNFTGINFSTLGTFLQESTNNAITIRSQNISPNRNTTLELLPTYTEIRADDFSVSASNKIYIDKYITKTTYNNNDIGLKLDFANSQFTFGDTLGNNGGCGIYVNDNVLSRFINIGDIQGNVNQTQIFIDDNNQLIYTRNQGNDIGLKLDFANGIYILGNNNPTFSVKVNYGLGLNMITLGDYAVDFNGTSLELNDTAQIIQTTNQGNYTGLKLDFAFDEYKLGTQHNFLLVNQIAFGCFFANSDINGLGINIADASLGIINYAAIGDFNQNDNGTSLYVSNQFEIIRAVNQNADNGLKLDFANSSYELGQLTGGNTTNLYISDSNQRAAFNFGGFTRGLELDFLNDTYRIGRFNGGNTTTFKIDDAASYALQFDGVNITSGTAGGNSGIHLKVKVKGVDYKIELKNP